MQWPAKLRTFWSRFLVELFTFSGGLRLIRTNVFVWAIIHPCLCCCHTQTYASRKTSCINSYLGYVVEPLTSVRNMLTNDRLLVFILIYGQYQNIVSSSFAQQSLSVKALPVPLVELAFSDLWIMLLIFNMWPITQKRIALVAFHCLTLSFSFSWQFRRLCDLRRRFV